MTQETYPTDSTYLQTFQDDNGPTDLTLAALVRFCRPPALSGGRVLELGCGHGVSLVARAACHPDMTFHGIDIMPEHIAIARHHAADAGLTNVTFAVGDIVELAQTDPPGGQYDHVVMHGVWSWVADDTRRAIVALLGRWAAPGALINVSYDAYPFWNLMEPLRYVLRELLNDGPGQHRMKEVRQVLEDWLEAEGTDYTRGMWERIKGMPDRFLIHEFISRDARPFWPQDVARAMEPAGVKPLGQVPLRRNIAALVHDNEALALLEMGRSRGFPRTAEDLIHNGSFRSDVLSRGAPDIKEATVARMLAGWRVFPGQPEQDEIENPKFPGMAQDLAQFGDDTPVEDVLSFFAARGGVGFQPFALTLALKHLEVHPPVTEEGRTAMQGFNRYALMRAREGGHLSCLICTKRGRAVRVTKEQVRHIALGEALAEDAAKALAPYAFDTGEG